MLAVVARRLQAQRLVGPRFSNVAQAVSWFGAVQGQEYRAALWGIGQRMDPKRGPVSEATVEAALATREVIRTWPMRGTLHFVAADDARWITRLLAPRIVRRTASRHRQLGLDEETLRRARACLEAALLGGKSLTRTEAYAALELAKLSPGGQRGIHILGRLAMEGVLCLAAPRGKQQTFALLDEWIPTSRELAGDAALLELARRYVKSHGPATLADFAWWSGLTLGEAKRALELAKPEVHEARGYWEPTGHRPGAQAGTRVYLLPPYDEYAVAYRDRSHILDARDRARAKNGIFAPIVLVDGRIAGTWGRTMKTGRVIVRASLWSAPSSPVLRALEAAVSRYGAFVGMEPTLVLASRRRTRARLP